MPKLPERDFAGTAYVPIYVMLPVSSLIHCALLFFFPDPILFHLIQNISLQICHAYIQNLLSMYDLLQFCKVMESFIHN